MLIDIAFENIIRKAREYNEPVTTEEEVEQAIKELKKKKSKDEWGWRNELIIEGKEEMKMSFVRSNVHHK